MAEPIFVFDVHLDLSMNALEWNRDLRWSLEKIRRWELTMKDKVDRGINTVCLPEMRKGRIGLCVATQIGRYSPYFHRLPGWNSPEQAWAQTQGQLAWYRIMEEQGELVQIRNRQQLDQHHLSLWRLKARAGRRHAPRGRIEEARRLPIGYILSLERGLDRRAQAPGQATPTACAPLGPHGPGRFTHSTDASSPPRRQRRSKEMKRSASSST
ncbi:MAG: hypothetical protein U0793_00820 [Gemmataceae bacterium]